MESSFSQLSKLLSGNLSQSEIAIIATQAVKNGDITLAELAFSQLQKKDALLKLYEGRLLSLKGDFKGFIDFSNIYSDSIKS